MENPKVQEPQSTNLWLAVRRNWFVVLAVTLGVFSFPAYKAFTKKPVFQSSALILVANQTAVPVAEGNAEEGANQVGNDLSTEIEILKSPALITRALKNLPMSYQNTPVSEISAGLSLQQNPNTRVLMVNYVGENPQVTHEVLKALVKTYVNYSRESRRSPITNSIRFIEAQLPEARQKLLETSDQLTRFRKTYNLDALDNSAATALESREGLQNQINVASMELARTQRLIQQLKQQAPDVNLNVSTIVSDTVLSQDATYQTLLTQLRTLESQYALARTTLGDFHPTVEDLKERTTETRRLLQGQVQRVLGKRRSQVAVNTTATGDIQQAIGSQLLNAQNSLAVQTAQLESLRKAETEAVKKLRQILSLQQTYRELQREYTLNSRNVDNFLGRLQEFKIREAQDTNTWKELESPAFPSTPMPNNLVRELIIGLVQGVIAGVGIAFLLEKFDRRLKGIQEIKDLTGLPVLGSLPKVSQKSLAPWTQPQDSSPKNLLSASARSIALALQFQQSLGMVQEKGKIFVITSAEPGEGKTTVTQNLGVTLAELGRKVLIVDANLNDPALHQSFGLANQSGLVTAIATSQTWQGFVQSIGNGSQPLPTEAPLNGEGNSAVPIPSRPQSDQQLEFFDHPGSSTSISIAENHLTETVSHSETEDDVIYPLDVLPSGLAHKQPVVWLASPKIPHILDQWRQSYDCVLIDTPSVNALADVQCLIPYVDGVILTVGLKRATRQLLTRTLEILQTLETNIAGLVVNFTPQAEVGD
jgi:polysaccharide biosynthesis transport protein